MIVRNDWAAFISQTGSELVNISKELGILPGRVVTNNFKALPDENLQYFVRNGVTVSILQKNPSAIDYITSPFLSAKLITLHGYLRIIPAEFFKAYKGAIYNGHPALISEYPELKGLNMQESIVGKKEQYPRIGSVIHEVTPILDDGKIVVSAAIPNTAINVEHAYALLRKTSLETWKYFFKEIWRFE